MQRSMLLSIRAGSRSRQPISLVINAVDRASEPQAACCADSSMMRQFSAATQPAVAAAAQVTSVSRAAWDADDLMQSPLVSMICRSYAKGAAKAKREQNRQAAPERTRQEPHKRHAPATPEGSLMDFTEEELLMDAALEHLKQELAGMRTGRASPGMLDHIRVEAYGEKMPLHTLATVLARDAQLLVASVYDPATLPAVEKAISASPLGLNPRIDGQEVLIPVPRPSPDTQEAMAKLCKQEVEAAKVSVRNARHGGLALLKSIASEDERFRAETELQRMTDKYVQLVEQLGAEKVKDIRTV